MKKINTFTSCGASNDLLKTIFSTLDVDCVINKWSSRLIASFGSYGDLSFFEEIYNSRGNHKLKLKCVSGMEVYNFWTGTSLNGLEYIDGLEEIAFGGGLCPNLNDISALASQKDTLKKITLSNASISDCRVFKELQNVTFVDLQNNPIGDYVGDASNLDNWNLKLICDSVTEGVRRYNAVEDNDILGTVKVKGTKCTNWTYYENGNWNKDSNYGS